MFILLKFIFFFCIVIVVDGNKRKGSKLKVPLPKRGDRYRASCFGARNRNQCGDQCGWDSLTNICAPADLTRHCAQYKHELGCSSIHAEANGCVWEVTQDVGYCIHEDDPTRGILPKSKPELSLEEARKQIQAKPNCFENTNQGQCSQNENNHCGWNKEFNLCGPISSFRMCFEHQRARCQRDATCHYDKHTRKCFDIRDQRLQ